MSHSGNGGSDAAGSSGYFESPQTLSRTAHKLAEQGYLNEENAESVQQCIKAYHDNLDDEVLSTLQPYIPAGIDDAADAQYAVKELANIVSTSLAHYARASSEVDREKAAETIRAALLRRREDDELADASNALETRNNGDDEGEARRTVVFSRLSASEKQRFMQFLVRNRVAFSKNGDEFVASIRMIPKKLSVPPNLHDDSSILEDPDAPPNSKYEEALFGKRAARPPQDQARIIRAMAKNSNFDFDFADYPKFTALLSRDGSQQPRIRPLPWLLRIIEDIYESRFTFDKQRIASDSDDAGINDDDRLSIVFPVFVIDFFSRKYGVRRLVDQNALDLLQSVHQFRESFLEVEVFARFLETFYGPEDLLFFLYLRSILEKHLGKNYFRKRWNDLGPAREKLHESTWVSYQMSAQVCRLAFGDDKASRQHCSDCLELVHKYSEPIGNSDNAPRRIRVIHLLQLMLDQYHRSRPAQSDPDTHAFLDSEESGLGNSTTRIESKDEQDRLFREAERHYEEFAGSQGGQDNGASGDGSTSSYVQRAQQERQARIKAMEDRIRAEIANKRNLGDSTRDAADDTSAGDTDVEPPPPQFDSDGEEAPPPPDDFEEEDVDARRAGAAFDAEEAAEEQDYNAKSTASLLQEIDQSIQAGSNAKPNRDLAQLLDLLGDYLQSTCNSEISRIADANRAGLDTLPQSFVEMIWSEANQKLQNKVEDIVQEVG